VEFLPRRAWRISPPTRHELGSPGKSLPRHCGDDHRRIDDAEESLERVEIAGPGFLNFFLKSNAWQRAPRTDLRSR